MVRQNRCSKRFLFFVVNLIEKRFAKTKTVMPKSDGMSPYGTRVGTGVVDSVWATAHTTQFTNIGWRYAHQASGGSGYLPATQAAEHHATILTECNVSLQAQRWVWQADGAIANVAGRCLSTRGGGRVHTERCDGSDEQRFRKHAAMKQHIESVAHPGACLDHNMASGYLDLYSCCMSPVCAEKNEEWSLTHIGSGDGHFLVSATNGECVAEDSDELTGGSGMFGRLANLSQNNVAFLHWL